MRPFLLFFCLLASIITFAQRNLTGSHPGSAFTYVYKLTTDEVETLYHKGLQLVPPFNLHSLVDSFRSDEPVLRGGNYLFVNALRNTIHYRLHAAGDLNFKAVNNNRNLVIALHNKQGSIITDATVRLNGKTLRYDEATKTFRRSAHKKGGELMVNHQGVLYPFKVEAEPDYKPHKPFWRSVTSGFPVKYIADLFRRNNRRSDFFWYTPYEQDYRGFIVFSKPLYKPGDTVKLKAFVTTKKGRPTDDALVLRLSCRDFSVDTILTPLSPYRNGGYDCSFVLTDRLHMDLDEEYLITLEKPGRNISLSDYNGDEDEEDLAAKRKVVMRGRFRYEEYELKSVTFSARSNKEVHHRGEAVSIFLKASDENGMAVMDGRVQLIVKPQPYNTKTFDAPKVFLPDTLWQHETALDAIGETKVLLPDSLFPQASFHYTVECIFLNSNNERQTSHVNLSFRNTKEWIAFEETGDSLRLLYFSGSKAASLTATVYATNNDDDTIEAKKITLPATIAAHPFAKTYAVSLPGVDEEHELKQWTQLVSALASRTADSVYVRLVNPHKLPVWYTVFAGNTPVLQGFGDSLFYAAKSTTAKHYFVSLQYIFGDEVQTGDFTVPYRDKQLTLTVEQPTAVYPGQTTTATVTVKDAEDKPVENADVTAWAFTKKFAQYRPPTVPYFGKFYPGRKRYGTFTEEESINEGTEKLVWERWSRQLHLDTVEYYGFLRPKGLYVNTQAAPDSLTQMAPFVTVNGELQPVHHIYLDEVPLFFSTAEHLQRYSFAVSPGKHNLKLRTHNKLVELDSFVFTRGVKTIISMAADTANRRIRIKAMPDTLTPYEQSLWSKYMLLMENNFGERYATVSNGDGLYLLNSGRTVNPVLTGPFPNRWAELVVKNGFRQEFEPEGSWMYRISPGFIKQKQTPSMRLFYNRLQPAAPDENFDHFVLTEGEIDSLWQRYLYNRSASEDLFRNPSLMQKNNGQLEIGLSKDSTGFDPFVRNLFLFRYDEPDFLRVYRGAARNLGYLAPGNYRLMLLLPGDKYFIQDSLRIQKDGTNYYKIGTIIPKERDSVSIHISNIIAAREKSWLNSGNDGDFDNIKESFNQQYLDATTFTETVTGIVRDEKGNAVIGASVIIKGTRSSTLTDRFGQFTLRTPPKAILVVSSVGFESKEMRIGDGLLAFELKPATYSLDEVVVVRYGTQRRSSMTGAVSRLVEDENKVFEGGLAGMAPGIRIRGLNSTDTNASPLIVVDGVPLDGGISSIDPSLIASMTTLKDGAATALYGDRAANGVVIITTKKNSASDPIATEGEPGNSLRRRFRDDGFWQPRLTTNQEGKATFNVTWPDDITSWRTFAIAINGNKQSGYTQGLVKSFKPVSANLAAPQFAVEGDTLTVIGKSLNYGTDSLQLQRSFYVNDGLRTQSSIAFSNAWMDTFSVVTGSADSLRLKYTVSNNSGWFDGEERFIPGYKKGLLQTDGFFAPLRGDTAFTIQPIADSGAVTLYAESSVLPVLEREVEALHRYEYLCNEQLASKLKGWLVQKRIDGFLKRPFKGEDYIRDIIGKLTKAKASSGLWGWWTGTAPQVWISLHVMEALLQAQREGYKVELNNKVLSDYLLYNIEDYNTTEALQTIHLLQLLGTKADYKRYTDSLQRRLPKMSLYEKLRLAEAKQKAGLEFSLDSLLPRQTRTMMGNVRWGEERTDLFDNAIQNSLLMYRLLKAKGGHAATVARLRDYFMERRRSGSWGNTYESSLVLETLLPDLLVNDSLPSAPTLTVNNTTINRFPYKAALPASSTITVNKSGGLPVYFTSYSQRWNSQPTAVEGEFVVTTSFEKNDEPVMELKGGAPVVMKIAVEVKADAEYVMVEAPIPAGCSYNDKSQPRSNGEVHREYFKNKVSIFCSGLTKGKYVFNVSFLPRYAGTYTLNPAKVECMYFPVFYGREGMKKVRVE